MRLLVLTVMRSGFIGSWSFFDPADKLKSIYFTCPKKGIGAIFA